ncbi:MAG: LysR family transcriptional regulator [Lacunisphaera sp.]
MVETKSFSKAAKLNGITQSAVSQQARAMERNFKTLMIDRSQKQFNLTAKASESTRRPRKSCTSTKSWKASCRK